MNESDFLIVRRRRRSRSEDGEGGPRLSPSRIRKDQMSTRMRRVVAKSLGLGLLAALSLAISFTGFAQSDNTQISGFVKDQAGGVIAKAKVSVKNGNNDLGRTA